MAEVTDVDIVAGVPTGGTGTVPTLSKTNTLAGAVNETAPATDTASSGLNGRLQRIAQRLTSLIALIPTALGAGGGLKVDGSGTALPVSGTVATTVADAANVTLGAKADAKSTATDTTAITGMSVWKQISASVQAIATSVAGTLTVGTHAVTGSGNFASTVADGANVTLGAKADAKSTATDTTSITAMSVWKQISASVQALVTAIGSTALDFGSGTSGTRTLRTIVDSSQLATLGQATAANCMPTVGPSDRQNSVVFAVTMSTDTAAYASGDLIADTQQLDAFFNKADGKGVITSVTIIEKDAQGLAYNILFHRTNTSMGTENSAPNISDANAVAGIQGLVSVASGDFVTVSGTKVACLRGLGIPVAAVSGTDDLYISILNGTGAPTYASGEITLLVGAVLD